MNSSFHLSPDGHAFVMGLADRLCNSASGGEKAKALSEFSEAYSSTHVENTLRTMEKFWAH
jgi:hypothetical protein